MSNSAASRIVLAPFSEETVVAAARETLQAAGGHASVGFVFVSADYKPQIADFLELVQLHAHLPMLAGCSGASLVGAGVEVENASGFSLLLLDLPETKIHVAPLTPTESGDVDWAEATGVKAGDVDAWIALADPANFPLDPWLEGWNAAYPGIPTIGGLASGGQSADELFVMRDRELVEGGVAVGFKGGVRVQALVSQGCRPIGEPMTITGADQNFVISLGNRPAYEVLQKTFEALPNADKVAAQGNIFAGLATSEYVDEFKTGDFLVRNLLGADPEQGVLAIGAYPRVGQTLQFQLRDGRSADAELRHLAGDAARAGGRPLASLLFACNGRGRHLFGVENHDAGMMRDILKPRASAGFFCNGEIGPVGGKNFVHGYTASAALFLDVVK